MYSKASKGHAWFIGYLGLIFITFNVTAQQQTKLENTNAEPLPKVELTVTPANCVALHQGRKCFAKVSLSWQVKTPGDFCIYQKVQNKVIQCWKNSRGSNTQFEFESSEKIEYQLVTVNRSEVLAETVVEVSWVHNATPRKRRWRLF